MYIKYLYLVRPNINKFIYILFIIPTMLVDARGHCTFFFAANFNSIEPLTRVAEIKRELECTVGHVLREMNLNVLTLKRGNRTQRMKVELRLGF